MNIKKPLLKIGDVARYLGVSKVTIYRMVEKGLLPAKVINFSLRFTPEMIETYLAGVNYDPNNKPKKGNTHPRVKKPLRKAKHRRSK